MNDAKTPPPGAVLLECIHIPPAPARTTGTCHWYANNGPVDFTRPDGSKGAAWGFMICNDCHEKFGPEGLEKGTVLIGGESIYEPRD